MDGLYRSIPFKRMMIWGEPYFRKPSYRYDMTENDVSWQVRIHLPQECLICHCWGYQPNTCFGGWMYVFVIMEPQTPNKTHCTKVRSSVRLQDAEKNTSRCISESRGDSW